MTEINLELQGVDELIQKIQDPAFLSKPLHDFMSSSMNILIENIVPLTPVDTGNLRGKIADRSTSVTIDTAAIPLWAQLKPLSEYSGFVEYDTRPHWPPQGALAGWAHRHGMPEFLVRRAIARRGTRGAHMFEDGMNHSLASIEVRLSITASEIETAWGK